MKYLIEPHAIVGVTPLADCVVQVCSAGGCGCDSLCGKQGSECSKQKGTNPCDKKNT